MFYDPDLPGFRERNEITVVAQTLHSVVGVGMVEVAGSQRRWYEDTPSLELFNHRRVIDGDLADEQRVEAPPVAEVVDDALKAA